MLFTSFPFICFLLSIIVLYYLVPKKCQWSLLLLASYAFYAIADIRYLLFIAVTTLSVYVVALKTDLLNREQKQYLADHKSSMTKEERQAYKSRMKAKRFRWLLLGLLFNLAILSVTKYTNFVIKTVSDLFSGAVNLRPVDLIIPMGISFYTFQSLGYIIDVYRGKQDAQRNPFKLALFVSFFPQLVQGPISRYGDLAPTLFAVHSFEEKTVSMGVMRILWGYFKKVVIADRLITAVTALTGNPDAYAGTYVFIAMLFYAFQLYCDFTGGIDIAIGIAETMGIRLTENFNLPYFSKNIKEYWNRWHITMGSWFTDYIFYPISVCSPMLKFNKWARAHLPKWLGKRVTVYIACFTVWFATGIWHGAAWNFIVWGLANFVVTMASQEMEPLYARFHKRFHVKGKLPYEIFQILRTILLMSAIRMFDCYRDVSTTFRMLGSMFTETSLSVFLDGSLMKLGLDTADYLILLFGLIVVLSVSITKAHTGYVREHFYGKATALRYHVMALLLAVILLFGAYGVGYDASQFIYNQF